jgi:hypothetical protein
VPVRLRAPVAAASLALLVGGCGSQASTATSSHRAASSGSPSSRAASKSTAQGAASTKSHGSGQSHQSAARPVTDRAAIRRAAAKLEAEPGYTFRISASLDVPSFGNAAKMTGSGSFDTAADAGGIVADVRPPGILSLLGEVETHVVLRGSELYMLMPDSLDGTPIGGKAWGEATFAQLEALAEVSGPHTLAGLLAALPHSHGARVWLDGQGRISRVSYAYRGAQLGRLAVAIKITGYGPHSAPTPPEPSATGSLIATAESLGL